MADVELYHAEPMSNSLKVLQAIHEKGVRFRSRYVDLTAFAQHDPEYLKINPAGQVPALVHRGRVLTESTVINEYIDDAFDGPPLKPGDLYQQGQMRVWTKYVDEVFRPALSFLAWDRVIPGLARSLPPEEFSKRLAGIPLADKRDKWEQAAAGGFSDRDRRTWRRQLAETVDKVESALDGHDWLVADMFTLADMAVFAMGHGMAEGYPDLVSETRTPNWTAWVERMRARAGVGAALAMPNRANWKTSTPESDADPAV